MRKIVTIAFLFSSLMAQEAVIILPSGYRLELPHTNNIQFDTIRVESGATFTAESPADFSPTIVTGNGTIITGQPLVSAVSSSTSDGAYNAGDTLLITVTFSENVTVTGTPQLTLETGSTDAVLNYVSGSGTATLVFSYIVASGHTSADLAYGSTAALVLPDTTVKIRDNLANDGVLTLPVPGATNSLQANKALVIDTEFPTAGTVNDGSGTDIAYTGSSSSLTANWTGFSDALSGIASYKAAIEDGAGSSVVAWTDVGNINTWTVTGLSLSNATTYHAVIRAADVAGNLSNDVSTNGVTVDTDGPVIGYVLDGDTGDMDWSNVTTALSLVWDDFSDTLSGLSYYEYAVGTTAGGAGTVSWTSATRLDSMAVESSLSLTNTTTYYASVRAVDSVANVSTIATSDGFTIDTDLPQIVYVNEGSAAADLDIQNLDTVLSTGWQGTDTSPGSGIQYYEVALGTAAGDSNIIDWYLTTDTLLTADSLALTDGETYFVSIRVTDVAGNRSAVLSGDGILIDVTPPLVGSVNDGSGDDIQFTSSTTTLSANWSGFSDTVSSIVYYEVALGDTTANNIVAWTNIGTATAISFENLSLTDATTYYFNVRATDLAGNVSPIVTSDGITIDIGPPVVGAVYDGLDGDDQDYQGPSDTLAIYWTGDGEIAYYQYSVGSTPGDTNVTPWTDNGTATSVVITDFVLTHETVYYANVRAYDMAGNMSLVQSSDGITADLSAPTVGWVNDGLSDDETFTASTTTLVANWNDFADTTSGIQYYEYVVGTTAGASDVSGAWVSVGTNTSFSATFTLDETITYYISIRATDNVNNVSTVVTSNGIITDFTGPQGTWAIDGDSSDIDWQNFTDTYSGYWLHFIEEGSGFKTHEYALYDNGNSQYETSWTATLDTFCVISGLALVENQTYSLHVRGIDSVDNIGAVLMSDGVLVDLSAPAVPLNLVGWFSTERIYLEWSQNTELDLDHYSIYGGTDMNPTTLLSTTADFTAEAFASGFEDGTTYYLRISATDIPGNESAFTAEVMGIPQQAAITRINPDPANFLNAEDTQLSIHFSDIGAASAVTIAYEDMDLTTTYSAADTAIIIQFNVPYASLDSIILTINNILDWSDTGADDKEIQLTTYMLADYDKNFQINAADLAAYLTGWQNDDYSYELGPVTGTVPHFIPTPNNVYDLDDVMTFVQMWYWYHQTFSFTMTTLADIGGLLPIEQQDRSLVVTLPDGAIAGQVFIQYPPASKNLTTAADATSEKRIYLSRNDDIKGEMLVEWADLSQDGMQTVSFDAQSLDRNDANITIAYTIYGVDQEIISRGMQNIKLVAIPEDYALHYNYPNPFNPVTTMLYDLPETGHTRLIIYDLLGREVHVLIDKVMNPGYYSTQWNGRNSQGQMVGAGVYLYQIQSNGFIQTRKMLLLK